MEAKHLIPDDRMSSISSSAPCHHIGSGTLLKEADQGGLIVNVYDLPLPELHRATQNTREHHEDQHSLVSCPMLSRQCLKKVELISRVTEIYP